MQARWTVRASDDRFEFACEDVSMAPDARLLFGHYLRMGAHPASNFDAAEVMFDDLIKDVARRASGPVVVHVSWTNDEAVLEIQASAPVFTRVILPVTPMHWRYGGGSAAIDQGASPPFSLASPDDMIDALIALAAVAVDPELSTHMTSVAELAASTAAALGMDRAATERCRLAARVHDIGLVAVNVNFLDWPNELDPWEWQLIRRHPQSGEAIVRAVPGLSHLGTIIRCHHERVDGGGYPDGLIGEEIPLESQVIAVADAFHAMTVPRVYRSIMSAGAAYGELMHHSGSQFDQEIVVAFGAMLGYGTSRIWKIADTSPSRE